MYDSYLVSTSSDSAVLAMNRLIWSKVETASLLWSRALYSGAKTPVLPDSQCSAEVDIPIVTLCWPRAALLCGKWLCPGLRLCLFFPCFPWLCCFPGFVVSLGRQSYLRVTLELDLNHSSTTY